MVSMQHACPHHSIIMHTLLSQIRVLFAETETTLYRKALCASARVAVWYVSHASREQMLTVVEKRRLRFQQRGVTYRGEVRIIR